MKFAHEFQEALKGEKFPSHWLDSAIPYGPLKKIIKKVRRELEELGLNPAELGADGVAFQYQIGGSSDEVFRPKLTLYYEGDEAVDATLSPETREHFEAFVARQRKNNSRDTGFILRERRGSATSSLDNASNLQNRSASRRAEVISLSCDADFFRLLQRDVTSLEALQTREQKEMIEQITALSKDMARLASPSKLTKTDMYRWRELFDIYLQAQIFFSTREQDHGRRTTATAGRQLGWFQNEVMKRGLVDSFKLPTSLQAFGRFVAINITLLQNLKFQEINQKAIGKILKKFDKRTHLGAKNTFPKLIESDAIMSEAMAKAVCARVSDNIVSITPQIDDGDYTCPICSTVAWRPIRLACRHVLCSKCTVHLQKTFKYDCPICRTKTVVKQANEDNIDDELLKRLKKYFPKETREKRIQLETEDGIATFGPAYTHPSEDKCTVM